jgi:hypothetical protein
MEENPMWIRKSLCNVRNSLGFPILDMMSHARDALILLTASSTRKRLPGKVELLSVPLGFCDKWHDRGLANSSATVIRIDAKMPS